VKTVAGTGAAFTIVPRHVLGRGVQAPSDTVNIATVGIGGMGGSNTMNVLSQNIVAACDVDDTMMQRAVTRFEMALKQLKEGGGQQRGGGRPRREPSDAQKAADARRPATDRQAALPKFVEQQLPKLKKYRDYREMLDKQKDIDAVIIATPDHMHYAVAAYAMDHGKHVYVQKPLTWSVDESRMLAKKATETKLVGQMGNQGHSIDDARTGYEYINSGVIGDIREVHVWTNRPLGFWPQGIPRPAPAQPPAETSAFPPAQRWNGRFVEQKIASALHGEYPVPPGLDWDLFLGVAPKVDYHPIYHPMNWRGWVDWGQGALGDMGAHLIDHPFWALDLGLPTTIETLSTPFNGASYPHATTTYFQFPARGSKPPVKLTWYDGGFFPPKPEEIGAEALNGEGGILYIGTKGKLMQQTYGANPRLIPQSKHDETPKPKTILPRIAHQEHEMNWVEAIKGKAEISCPLEYAAALNEVMLLGVVALRAGSKITYDGANMKVTSGPVTRNKETIDPNDYLRREPRPGFIGTR
jgi:predicted dehydrogenase